MDDKIGTQKYAQHHYHRGNASKQYNEISLHILVNRMAKIKKTDHIKWARMWNDGNSHRMHVGNAK